ISAEDIKKAERERMAQAFASDSSRGKETTAHALLAMTDLSAANILTIWDTIPNAKPNAFEAAMNELRNPDIQPAQEAQEESTEAVAERIAALAGE
ncbi:MAG: hypothetical protein IJ677_00970, partial [Alphaproteobacteria bacterium]|nr:hypothetical protein [Alphaproteobacteria bacterium]